MSLLKIFSIAGSGMAAQSQRLNTVASNIANADSAAGTDGNVYKARQVQFETVPVEGNDANTPGVRVAQITESDAAARRVYDPKHPFADKEGFVAMPNVNVVDEMVNMISASRSYQANVDVMNTAKTLASKTLTLGS